ncbi:hypothetical protein EJD97_001989 [Solanum chilense]|uniref:Integrase core domain containing protein n=1 Tax=Solanum chilense TaxID=4083 RepID=A0A6N2ALS6_SOLCI|nr:hypothetical protein EJD97_001989 [Solanum chilense]
MTAMIAGFEVDFPWLLQAVMHERAFKVTTTYPLPCMIFALCRSAGPRPKLPPLSDDLADTVAQAHTTTQASNNTTPVEYISGSSTAPSSSRTDPLPALVPLSRVQKLEAQMTTFLHHIQPWMQKSITESEERLERKMVQFTERKIVEAAVDSLCADIDTILKAREPESEATSVEPAEDTSAKRRRGRAKDEARARKKEHREIVAARRASIAEEAAHQMRASELAAGASRSRTVEIAGGTTDGAVVAEDTTEGVQNAEDVGFGELDPTSC